MANADIIHTIQGLRAMLETLETQLSGGKVSVSKAQAPAAEKPKREPSAAMKAWNAEIEKVKAEMLADGWTHPETGKPVTRKDAMQEASRRRAADPDAPKPKPKPKAAPKEDVPSDADLDTSEKPKPKRTLSKEQLEKMAAGRKAAAERRKAEKAAAAVGPSHPTTATEPAPEKKVTFAHPPLPASDDDEEQEEVQMLQPINIKARKYLYEPLEGGCWKRNDDGTKGEWAGLYDQETKTLNQSVPEDLVY
jgi:hypothetical protein